MAKKERPIKWVTNTEESAYMRMRQEENVVRSKNNPNEAWMAEKLLTLVWKWGRQSRWGYRIFDFWCVEKGIAVEVDGPEHNKQWDKVRDDYNLQRSGILVLRVRNRNEADAAAVLKRIDAECTWNERREKLGAKPVYGCTCAVEARKRREATGKSPTKGRMKFSGRFPRDPCPK